MISIVESSIARAIGTRIMLSKISVFSIHAVSFIMHQPAPTVDSCHQHHAVIYRASLITTDKHDVHINLYSPGMLSY